ncbi:WD40-containing domain protein [Mycena sanguinolenta]|uniref:WD40-containing domain protein n=1 Tax=Mycena sanguinolenta TaxID=230812 RepID=A0A8H6Z7S6_9AGAR|nr:WD40-containing domain protein [Mycena sanguinolenta]
MAWKTFNLTPTDSDFYDDEGEWTEYFAGVSKLYHPLSAVNEYLLDSAPDATVAVTHDDEWMSMMTEDDQVVPDASELIQRICHKYSLVKAPGNTLEWFGLRILANKMQFPKILQKAQWSMIPASPSIILL